MRADLAAKLFGARRGCRREGESAEVGRAIQIEKIEVDRVIGGGGHVGSTVAEAGDLDVEILRQST